MWSTNISILFFALITIALGADDAVDSNAAWASNRYISVMTANRAPGVDAAKASSEANHMWTQVWNHAPFHSLAAQATALHSNGMIDKDRALQLVQQASSEYNKWSAGPSFASVTQYYKSNIKDFNVAAISRSGESQFEIYAPIVTPQISQFFADAKGQQISQTVKALATHIDADFNERKRQ